MALAVARVDRVQHEVDEHLLDLVGVGAQRGQGLGGVDPEGDIALGGMSGEEILHDVQGSRRVDLLRGVGHRPDVVEQLLEQAGHAVDLVQRHLVVGRLGMAGSERHIFDPQNGLPGNIGLLQAKPPSYLDVPPTMRTGAVDVADPQNPVGTKGVGEPVMGCAAAALLCAISDALGGHVFNRTPVSPDMIVNFTAGRAQSHKPLQIHTF